MCPSIIVRVLELNGVRLDFQRECLFANDVGSSMLLPAWWRLFFPPRENEAGGPQWEWAWSMCFCFSRPFPSTLQQQPHKRGLECCNCLSSLSEEGSGWQLKLQQLSVCRGRKARCWELGPSTTFCLIGYLYLYLLHGNGSQLIGQFLWICFLILPAPWSTSLVFGLHPKIEKITYKYALLCDLANHTTATSE